MFSSFGFILLTVLQVICLTGALPRPQGFGQFVNSSTLRVETIDKVVETEQSTQLRTVVLTDNVLVIANSTAAETSFVTSVLTVSDTETVTLDPAPSFQTPTTTSVSQSIPDTTGTIHSTLDTSGVNSGLPFPINSNSVTTATLSPIETGFPFANATQTEVPSTSTTVQIVTVPTTTATTIFETSTAVTTTLEIISTVKTVTTFAYTTTVSGAPSVGVSTAYATVLVTSYTIVTDTVPVSSTVTSVLGTTLTTASVPTLLPTASSNCTSTMGCTGQDIFLPVALGDIPDNIQRRGDHPVPRLGIQNQTCPIETNKFYANFFLGTQGQPTYTHPYSLTWSKGSGNAMSWGMAVSQIDADQRVDGAERRDIPDDPVSYYINPLGIQSLVLSASELGSSTVLTSDTLLAFSANINLLPASGSSSRITFPIVQGMAFVTGLYKNLQPAIESSIFFQSVRAVGSPKPGIFKYQITLNDGKNWLLYVAPSNGVDPKLQLQSNTLLQGQPGFTGTIQIAKNPGNGTEALYDSAAGVYATGATISGYADGSSGSYTLSWTKSRASYTAANNSLLIFALPHHVQSMDPTTKAALTTLQLDTTTKGVATAVLADSWTLVEPDLPVDMDFAPWRPNIGSADSFSDATISVINQIAAVEISQNMTEQVNVNSMYYSGKALSKFATLVWTINQVAKNPGLAAAGLVNLKAAFAIFADQKQQFPLVYDTVWGGVVSSGSYVTGDAGVDFGNSYYNDHHFHYGYHIHAAAIIGSLDPTWLAQNRDYVNTLVRDASNPSLQDQHFPFSRSFDWYHGHSWAKGLYESADGKDQESTSEDAMFAYALKMWGKTIGDASMEARGNMMLSILSRSFQNYFLMESSNTNQPANYIGNKVTGILFDNKVDHTTYFGTNLEYIQGIHMIPLMPFSTLTRSPTFVAEEWQTYFADGAIDQASLVTGGWKGLLYANLAIINPSASWAFFSQPDFDPSWLDGGATRTWYLAYAAGLGGAA